MFASRKRARDDEEDDYEECTRVIKQCRLPFRTSPTTKYGRGFSQSLRNRPSPLFTQTITPADSSEEETSPPFSSLSQARPQSSTQLNTDASLQMFEQNFDLDMDMLDYQLLLSPRYQGQSNTMPSPKASPCTVTSPPPAFRDPFKDYQSSISGGRLPTPIYGHFQQSIDTKMDMGEDPENIIPRSQQEIEYEKHARRRRLPTPIDEDEVVDSLIPMERLQRFTEQHYAHPFVRTSAMVPPPRPTRLSFSMGIRADCELCRMRVPGHSNHIIKS